jgi:hypothetical protein
MDPRPTRFAPNVVRASAVRMIAAMRQACNDLSGFESAGLVDQLTKVLLATDDAFERATLLQVEGWPVDQRMVDIIHRRSGHENFALIDAETEWTTRTGVRAPCDEGDVIVFLQDHLYVSAQVEAVFKTRSRVVVRVLKDHVTFGGQVFDLPAERIVKIIDNGHPRGVDVVRSMVGFRLP